jgi:protein involved in polysaccharide export with SLBB domain
MVARADGTRRSIDLMSYYATGDTENNPYLLDGDVIEIPPYHEFRDVVEVYGPVPFAGRYPFRPGDTVTRVLRIGLGTTDLSSVDRVRVTSRADDGSQSVTVDVAAIVAGDALDVPLRVGDTVRIEQFDVPTAAVYGQVRYPGIYPINAGQTTVKELLETVGGLIDDADLAAAYMERQRPSFLKGTPGVSDLDFFGRALFQRARQASRIAVDIEHLLSSDDDFVLESGDVLVVPRRQTSVYVVGNVPAGGYVPFIEGADAAYYIEQAGGRASLSREVYVFRPTSGEVRKGLSQPVRSGETIYVDREPFAESPDLQNLLLTENTSRRQLKLLSTQTVISGVSAIAAIITTVVAIRR